MGKMDKIGATSGKCDLCNEDIEHKIYFGNHMGDGQELAANMLGKKGDIKSHPLYAGLLSLQAHHIIVTEAMSGDNNPWKNYVQSCGYDINHEKNGVFLTSRLDVACKLKTPLHRGNHSDTETGDNKNYPTFIKDELETIERQIQKGSFCEKPDALRNELDKISEITLRNISDFNYTLTFKGKDYKIGNAGCCGATSLGEKRRILAVTPNAVCKHREAHVIEGRKSIAELSLDATEIEDAVGVISLVDKKKIFNPKATDPLEIGK